MRREMGAGVKLLVSLALMVLMFVWCTASQAEIIRVHEGRSNTAVVFIHGLFGSPLKTFKSTKAKLSWPEIFAADNTQSRRFPGLTLSDMSVFSASYPTGINNKLDVDELAVRLRRQMVDAGVFDKENVILIAHSLGGILAKRIFLQSKDHPKFGNRIGMIFLIAVPSQGSDLARFARYASGMFPGASLGASRSLLEELSSIEINRSLRQTEKDWNRVHRQGRSKTIIHCAYEKLGYKIVGLETKLIVPLSSASTYCSEDIEAFNADHVTIVQPGSSDASIHSWVRGRVLSYCGSNSSCSKGMNTKATVVPKLKSGAVFDDCDGKGWCPYMTVLPAGFFNMGSLRNKDEQPIHQVQVESFAVGVYEITFNNWQACIDDGACRSYRPQDEGWGKGNRPVTNVSWEDAVAYVQWLSRKTGVAYRLLTEEEWEYAARAGSSTRYSWGNYINCEKASFDGGPESKCSYLISGKLRGTFEVGSYEPNGFGLYDMHGNVWEWVQDCWTSEYLNKRRGTKRIGTGSTCNKRVLRGGSWGNDPDLLRSANRVGAQPNQRNNGTGFRVARSLSRSD